MIDRLYVIPARMKSTRFPGKPLAKIWGKEMILLTYERILSAGINKENIVVAIDTDKDLMNLMIANDIKYEIINDAVTGTDRVAEVARRIEARYYINLQGDEPLMPVENIYNFRLHWVHPASPSMLDMAFSILCSLYSTSLR